MLDLARVIQEELLKDFSTRSEMSDWFNRVILHLIHDSEVIVPLTP